VAAAAPASTVYGSPDTLSFSGLAPTATGKVRFTTGGTTLCTVTLPATSCSTAADLDAGTYVVAATYSGDRNHEEVADTTSFSVVKAASPFDAGVSAKTAPAGERVVLSATGLPAGATGTVTFSAGGRVLCTAALPETSCSTSSTVPAGAYQVIASYSGDDNHEASTSTTSFVITAVTKVTMTASTSGGASTSTVIPGADSARSVAIIRQPAHGTATLVDGRVVYTPAAGFVGTDTVTVRVVDADGTVRFVTVNVSVAGAQARLPVTGHSVLAPGLIGTALLAVGCAAAWTARRPRA
jgi:hypothetical protein